MSYRIEVAPKAQKQLKAMSRDVQARLRDSIGALSTTPRPPGFKKLSGENNLYRIRVGDYRIIYQIQNDILLIIVVKVGHRREVYR